MSPSRKEGQAVIEAAEATTNFFEHGGALLTRGHVGADEERLASGSLDRTVRLWDVATGKNLKTLQGHRFSVQNVVFSPDGSLLASTKMLDQRHHALGQPLDECPGDTLGTACPSVVCSLALRTRKTASYTWPG